MKTLYIMVTNFQQINNNQRFYVIKLNYKDFYVINFIIGIKI